LAVEEVPEEDYMLPLSEAEVSIILSRGCIGHWYYRTNDAILILQVIRKGSDITLIGWGAQLAVLKEACEDAAKVSCYRTCTSSIKLEC
jgi:2-oxoisovalerate dehydrogenase E1 component beta subunit